MVLGAGYAWVQFKNLYSNRGLAHPGDPAIVAVRKRHMLALYPYLPIVAAVVAIAFFIILLWVSLRVFSEVWVVMFSDSTRATISNAHVCPRSHILPCISTLPLYKLTCRFANNSTS